MTHFCYMDETGTDSGSSHYSIGALIYPLNFESTFNEIIEHARKKFNFSCEIKWSKTHKNFSLINLGLFIFYEILNNPSLSYQCITVDKASYRKWCAQTKEEAFYITFTQIITKAADLINDELIICCDKRNDRYDKHHEVCQIISNHFLKLNDLAKIKDISCCDSKECDSIQAVDYITGAINASHRYFFNSRININPGKICCIKLMSQMLGWDNLSWDTWKNHKFNIWAFPVEFRATRGFSKNFNPRNVIPPIYLSSAEDITKYLN